MGNECKFVIWSCIRIRGEVLRDSNWFKPVSSFLTNRSKAVPLVQFFFVRVSAVLYVAFVLSLCVLHLYFSWCFWKAVLRECDILTS